MTQSLCYTVCSVASVCVIVLSGCDHDSRPLSRLEVTNPSPLIAGSIVPQPLALAPVVGGRCPFLTPFTTTFDLVIDQQSTSDLFLDQVTIRLFDGSSVGGSPLLMSAADLAARFQSTRIRPRVTSRFGFTPRFDCSPFVPRSMHVDVLLRDGTAAVQTTRLVVPIR